ncbi:MAG: glucose-6-phosphate dehydrogenase assembly protein OpcA [Bryobacteraceae bacterium]|nr:glucose-6-phosphate dehydrogenase assembly protein OpcA [Bryobacteraceae bacterium]
MPSKIEPDRLLRELNQLWASLGLQDGDASSHGVLRACSMTLIVVTESPSADPSLAELLAALMRDHPSRAVVIRLGAAAGRDLAATVNAQCWKPFGSRQQICSELIEITAGRDAIPDLPPVLRGLAAPDLPVIVWLHQPALLDLPPLDSGDKLIVNTAGVADARAVLARLRRLAAGSRLAADLSWTRLTRWRETLAHVFAHPVRQSRIAAIDQVTVSYAGQAVPVRALYLSAWLQSVLGDKPNYRLESVPAACARSEVERVELSGAGIHVVMELRDEASAELRLDGLTIREPFAVPGEYELLREELSVLGRDPVYDTVLAKL